VAECERAAETIRSVSADLISLVGHVNRRLERLAYLCPQHSVNLVGDVALSSMTPSVTSLGHRMSVSLNFPQGLGLCIWPDVPNGETTVSPTFISFGDVPEPLQRLLIPHVESVLTNLRSRICR